MEYGIKKLDESRKSKFKRVKKIPVRISVLSLSPPMHRSKWRKAKPNLKNGKNLMH